MTRAGWRIPIDPERAGRPSPGLVRAMRRLAPVLRLANRPTLEGTEHLPRGSFLLVANHSGGLGLAEIAAFAVTYLEQVGPERPLAAFAHPVGFRVYPFSKLIRAFGAVPSTYEAAEQTLAMGIPLLVFPGGDYETLRPIWQANRVDFGGRLGFLRIARAAGVPVVPLGIRGGHLTAPVLVRSRLLATLLVVPRLLGVKRWGLSLLGVLVAAPAALLLPLAWPLRAALVWLWLGSVLVFVPWIPWTIRMRIGPPVPASELFAREPDDEPDDELQRALASVERAVQRLVDR